MKMNLNLYKNFLEMLEKQISSKEFQEKLVNVQSIDLRHWKKRIFPVDLIKIIDEQKNKDIENTQYKNIRIFNNGNPEVIFQIMLECLRKNVNLNICIYDFCYGQNKLIVTEIQNLCETLQLDTKIELNNMLRDADIKNDIDKFDKNIVIGNSNLFNRLYRLSNIFEHIPYGIFEIYSDSEEFNSIKEKIYDMVEIEQFDIEDFSDLEIKDLAKIINKSGYKFSTIILSKDKEKMNILKTEIDSRYVFLNENPFKKIKFDFNVI